MANTALARKILTLIELNQEAFEMESWFAWEYRYDSSENYSEKSPLVVELENETTPTCGTTMCLAGWAAVANGWVLKSERRADGRINYGAFATKGSTEVLYRDVDDCPDEGYYNQCTDFVRLGADLLEIPLDWAELLFETYNSKAKYFLRLLASGEEFEWADEWYNYGITDVEGEDA